MTDTLRLGTRGSKLAVCQSQWVASEISRLGIPVTLEIIRTTGDRITDRLFTPADGKGVFVMELEKALLAGDIDIAVHSMKDLPGEMTDGLALGAVPEREEPRDVLIARQASSLSALPAGSSIGTSSLRRRAQLLSQRPDLRPVDLRGNIDTRLRKLDDGEYDAICLAAAGLHRLGLAARITEYLDLAIMVPAVGQGALAIQTRAGDRALRERLQPLHHPATAHAVKIERAVLASLGGGCSIPLGVLALGDGGCYRCTAILCSPGGEKTIRLEHTSSADAETFGYAIASELLRKAEEQGITL